MLIFLINLQRRPDRLRFMKAQLESLGLPFERIEAFDGLDSDFGPMTRAMSGAERACAMSHRSAWMAFLKSGGERCLILEDDVVLSEGLRTFLAEPSNIPADVHVLRLETMFIRTRLGPAVACCKMRNFKIHRLHSTHFGCAAYIISRSFAEAAVRDLTDFLGPIDHVLFAPTEDCFYPPAAHQLRPALCVQAEWFEQTKDLSLATSDLHVMRSERFRRNAIIPPPKQKRPFIVKCRREVARWGRRLNANRKAIHEFLVTRSFWRKIAFAHPAVTAAAAALHVSRGEQAVQPEMPAL
jgi:glycosyl transferase family 25